MSKWRQNPSENPTNHGDNFLLTDALFSSPRTFKAVSPTECSLIDTIRGLWTLHGFLKLFIYLFFLQLSGMDYSTFSSFFFKCVMITNIFSFLSFLGLQLIWWPNASRYSCPCLFMRHLLARARLVAWQLIPLEKNDVHELFQISPSRPPIPRVLLLARAVTKNGTGFFPVCTWWRNMGSTHSGDHGI
jgi:hypothetical protein